MPTTLRTRNPQADEAATLHSVWRDACAAVQAAYDCWLGASGDARAAAYGDYELELDREERAAARYRTLLEGASATR